MPKIVATLEGTYKENLEAVQVGAAKWGNNAHAWGTSLDVQAGANVPAAITYRQSHKSGTVSVEPGYSKLVVDAYGEADARLTFG
jgi:hypothetical protein